MAIVSTKCENCGSCIQFDGVHGKCTHCDAPFLHEVECVTQNFNSTTTNYVVCPTLDEETLVARARQYQTQFRFDIALEYANRALDINPGNKTAYEISNDPRYGGLDDEILVLLARQLQFNQKYDKAEDYARMAFAKNPNNKDAKKIMQKPKCIDRKDPLCKEILDKVKQMENTKRVNPWIWMGVFGVLAVGIGVVIYLIIQNF
ncbi:MAG: tetratricopeptide repeat protein [Firmicutes bacterium]|nr:tetratricopeptide repeat protein [Bacillota bacterium]